MLSAYPAYGATTQKLHLVTLSGVLLALVNIVGLKGPRSVLTLLV